nr:hypothetical protein [Streptomyces sp. DHE17-7]
MDLAAGARSSVSGQTPGLAEATWLNNTICLDTGAVFGGKLTALRWPERELVDVPAERVGRTCQCRCGTLRLLAGDGRRRSTLVRMCTAAGWWRPGTPGGSPCARRTRRRPWRS